MKSVANNRIAALVLAAGLLLSLPPSVTAEAVPAGCRIDEGPCAQTVRNVQVTFDLSPKPVKTMSELMFTVTLQERSGPVDDAGVVVDLTMPGMPMGRNVVQLRRNGSAYEGRGIIIRCPTGKKDWRATVLFKRAGTTSAASFDFEVKR